MDTLPLTTQTLYQDLLQAHLDRAPDAMEGSPFQRMLRGKPHWYVKTRRPDGEPHQTYIGPDDARTREAIARWRAAAQDNDAFRKANADKVRSLRAARLPALDMATGKTLRALAKAGAFRLGGVLVGTHAYRLYDAELGVRVAGVAAITQDVDVASFQKLSMAMDDAADPDVPTVLDALGLAPVASLNDAKPTRWRMGGGSDFVVDFLSPAMGPEEEPQRLEALGVWAQGLRYLNFLLRDPIPAVALYREGVLVRIPAPERYAIHKLIVAERRTGEHRAKASKDCVQAEALITALVETRPDELTHAYAEARGEGARWAEHLDAALRKSPSIAERLTAAA